ncbi:Voltage-dependent anion channel [Phaffia rhodozyma]|uniref:Voltage-dependent anion channel n=1 Tax=Phaffia rhodozyma TaxID=264483 RepID=A0A0F7SM63_PHARH|nr:Voltage-dependent anion channel [Phaffia rhodozyma]
MSTDHDYPSSTEQKLSTPSHPIVIQTQSSHTHCMGILKHRFLSTNMIDSQKRSSSSTGSTAAQVVDVVEETVEDKVKGISERIKHFSPSWFSCTMGVGIPCTLILNIPYPVVHHLRVPATIFVVVDTILFTTFTIIFAVRYLRWPEIWPLTMRHPMHSLFLGCYPMSCFTLISGGIGMKNAWGLGDGWLWALSYLWWISCVISIAVALLVPFNVYTTHTNIPENTTAAYLLPVVPNITAASIGAVLAYNFVPIDTQYAMHIWVASYVLLGPGILVALMLLTLYLQRLIFHHIPPREVIVSSFLPLGPTGLAGFSALKLGVVATMLFPLVKPTGGGVQSETELGKAMAGWALWGVGLGFAILLWGLGIWFMLIALGSFFLRWREKDMRFNMGWWGFTFPLASLTLSTQLIGEQLDNDGFKVMGTIMTCTMILLVFAVSVPTIQGCFTGSKRIFAAPCLADMETPSSSSLPDSGSGSQDGADVDVEEDRQENRNGLGSERTEKIEKNEKNKR